MAHRTDIDWLREEGVDKGVIDTAVAMTKALEEHVSPPGALKIKSKILERQRLTVPLIDACFKVQAMGSKVFVYQLDRDMFGKGMVGSIYMPDTTATRESRESPRAVIVSAGLDALDVMRGSGIGLGHTILLSQPSPLHVEVGYVGGKLHRLLIIDVRDLTGSEDYEAARLDGRVEVFWDPEDGEHKLRDPRHEDEEWDPDDVPNEGKDA